MDDKTTGAWVIHHSNKLQHVTGVGEFERIQCAGKCGTLLSALAADKQAVVPRDQVNVLARAGGINSLTELPVLLNQLAAARVVQLGASGDVEVLGVPTSGVLSHTAKIFASLQPSRPEEAVISLAESVSTEPLGAKRAAELLGDTHKLSGEEVREVLKSSEEIGFTDAEEVGKDEKIYFNGHIFRRDSARKMQAVMCSLSGQDEERIRTIESMLRASGCLELSEVKKVLGHGLFEKMQSIGMYDVNSVSNLTETVSYVTRPSAFAKYGDSLVEDAMDLAKAFVASLTYGMQRSSGTRGKITMIEKLLRKLINGRPVGPVEAIGEDYRVLELKGVVKLKHEIGKNYYMRLLKREVGELALQVITQGDASENSLPRFLTASMAKYVGPEPNREITRRKQLEPARRAVASMVQTLRTGGRL